MRPTTLFLDLDDVLNKFSIQALMHVGCPVGGDDYAEYPEECGWDIVAAVNKLLGITKDSGIELWTPDDFWSYFEKDFWVNIPRSDEFDDLLDIARIMFGYDNTYILTSPIVDPQCAAGKIEWIEKNLPKELHRNYVITPHKELCKIDGALLIDDNMDNIKKFDSGMTAALAVSRPWNPYTYTTDGIASMIRTMSL